MLLFTIQSDYNAANAMVLVLFTIQSDSETIVNAILLFRIKSHCKVLQIRWSCLRSKAIIVKHCKRNDTLYDPKRFTCVERSKHNATAHDPKWYQHVANALQLSLLWPNKKWNDQIFLIICSTNWLLTKLELKMKVSETVSNSRPHRFKPLTNNNII